MENHLNAGDGWHNEADYVFTRECGCPMSPDRATREFSRFVKETGFRKITLHGLRHAHASALLAGGVHPKIVSERLGHESIQITLDLYSHVVPGLQDAVAAMLDTVLPLQPSGREQVGP